MSARILLFDIDGTLVRMARGPGRYAMNTAFVDVFDVPNAFEGISFAGQTDRSLVRRALEKAGRPFDESAFQRFSVRYCVLLEEQMTPESRQASILLPGVEGLLETLASQKDTVAVGIGTGNMRQAAILKLRCFGLQQRFAFGGYGCDADQRSELLRIAAERGSRQLNMDLHACVVTVIGDTPFDVSAALACGYRCHAVATGSYDASELEAAGADHVFADLNDKGVLERMLSST